MKKLEKIKGDASYRKFYRKIDNKKSSIIVYSKKEKFKNLLIYDAINKILNKNKVLAPELYQENYRKNSLEIQDFGKLTMYKVLRKKQSNKFMYLKKIINLLIKIQSIKDKSIYNFKKSKYVIPKYEKKILLDEASLFCDWFVKRNLSQKLRSQFIKNFRKIIRKLLLELKLKNDTFVHRDFHVSNLMLVNNKIGVIDSQDALIGNQAYDLASLIDDVRFKTSDNFKYKIYNFFINKQKKLDKKKFKNDFEILSILRNLKIIGIFTRLAVRDKKNEYLKLIPYTWKLINLRINQNEIFSDLKKILMNNFEGKIK